MGIIRTALRTACLSLAWVTAMVAGLVGGAWLVITLCFMVAGVLIMGLVVGLILLSPSEVPWRVRFGAWCVRYREREEVVRKRFKL